MKTSSLLRLQAGSGAGGLMGCKGGCCSYQGRNLINQIEPQSSGHTAKPRGLSVTGCSLSFLGLFIFFPLSDRLRCVPASGWMSAVFARWPVFVSWRPHCVCAEARHGAGETLRPQYDSRFRLFVLKTHSSGPQSVSLSFFFFGEREIVETIR